MSDLTQETNANPPNSHTEQEWQKKFFAMGAMCHYCHKPLTFKEATKDHRTPKCRGGSNRIWNIVPACLPCNQKKGWRTEAEFLKARPAFDKSTKSQPVAAKEKPKAKMLPVEEQIDPFLLKKIMAERDDVTSGPLPPRAHLEERNEPQLLDRLIYERENKLGWWKSA